MNCLDSNREEIRDGYLAVVCPIDLNNLKRCQLFVSVAKNIFHYCYDETSKNAENRDEAFNTIVEFFNNELGFPKLNNGFKIERDMLETVRREYKK